MAQFLFFLPYTHTFSFFPCVTYLNTKQVRQTKKRKKTSAYCYLLSLVLLGKYSVISSPLPCFILISLFLLFFLLSFFLFLSFLLFLVEVVGSFSVRRRTWATISLCNVRFSESLRLS